MTNPFKIHREHETLWIDLDKIVAVESGDAEWRKRDGWVDWVVAAVKLENTRDPIALDQEQWDQLRPKITHDA